MYRFRLYFKRKQNTRYKKATHKSDIPRKCHYALLKGCVRYIFIDLFGKSKKEHF